MEGEAEVPVDQGRCTNDLRGTARNGEREKLILLCMILLVIQATVGLKWEETRLNEIVIPTNWYALQMSLRPRPENYRQVWSWPPRFLQRWKELTSCELDIWLALVYMHLEFTTCPQLWTTGTPTGSWRLCSLEPACQGTGSVKSRRVCTCSMTKCPCYKVSCEKDRVVFQQAR